MREPTVSARVARGAFAFAVSRGADADALARRSGIDPAATEVAAGRVPFTRYVALMRAAKELCGDPAFALHFGEEVRLSDLSLLPLLGSGTGVMEDDVGVMNRYGRLDADLGGSGGRFRLARIDGRVWLIDDRPEPNAFPEYTESFFARAVSEMRRLFGEAPFVESIHMTHPEPPYRAEYDRIFRVPLFFGSDRNALVLLASAWPAETSDGGYAAAIVRGHADALLETLESEESLRGRIERLLVPLLPTAGANVEAVAAALGLSRQTLFRKLKAEGATFEGVLDGLRHKMAVHYLEDRSASVNETAWRLGYSDPAAFSRAFKRWTGRSPGRRKR